MSDIAGSEVYEVKIGGGEGGYTGGRPLEYNEGYLPKQAPLREEKREFWQVKLENVGPFIGLVLSGIL